MQKTVLVATLGLAAFLAGCVPSLNPLYTEKDLVFDPALLGVWSEKENSTDGWTFRKKDDKSYQLLIQEGEKSSPFIAHLVQLGKYRFLDLYPDEAGLKDFNRDDIYKMTLIPGHLFLKVSRIDPTLQIGFLNVDWLDKLLKKSPGALRHQRLGEDKGLVLTASTKELQKFMLKHVNTKDAFGESSDLKREKDLPEKKPEKN